MKPRRAGVTAPAGGLAAWSRRGWPAVLWLGMLAAPAALGQPVDSSLEYKVKAAYLLNFTRYVEWPESSFPLADTPLIIGVLGDDPFGEVLDKTVAARTSNGRPVQVRRLARPDLLGACHLVFVARTERGREAELLEALRGRPVLTVGESDSFLRAGGHIRFLIVEDSVRFAVNLAAAEEAGLVLSSRMLSLAVAVAPDGHGRGGSR